MKSIGLTGGIGSGKTLVARMFADLGVPVIDADQIAHALTTPGSTACRRIEETFGSDFFDADGSLDRRRLRNVVFDDPAALQRLEAILHPLIRERIVAAITDLATQRHDYCIVSIPLLIETGMTDLVDHIVVVDVPEHVQIARVIRRDGVSAEEARKILDRQANRTQRLAAADFVIDNSGSIERTRDSVGRLDARLRALITS